MRELNGEPSNPEVFRPDDDDYAMFHIMLGGFYITMESSNVQFWPQ